MWEVSVICLTLEYSCKIHKMCHNVSYGGYCRGSEKGSLGWGRCWCGWRSPLGSYLLLQLLYYYAVYDSLPSLKGYGEDAYHIYSKTNLFIVDILWVCCGICRVVLQLWWYDQKERVHVVTSDPPPNVETDGMKSFAGQDHLRKSPPQSRLCILNSNLWENAFQKNICYDCITPFGQSFRRLLMLHLCVRCICIRPNGSGFIH